MADEEGVAPSDMHIWPSTARPILALSYLCPTETYKAAQRASICRHVQSGRKHSRGLMSTCLTCLAEHPPRETKEIKEARQRRSMQCPNPPLRENNNSMQPASRVMVMLLPCSSTLPKGPARTKNSTRTKFGARTKFALRTEFSTVCSGFSPYYFAAKDAVPAVLIPSLHRTISRPTPYYFCWRMHACKGPFRTKTIRPNPLYIYIYMLLPLYLFFAIHTVGLPPFKFLVENKHVHF